MVSKADGFAPVCVAVRPLAAQELVAPVVAAVENARGIPPIAVPVTLISSGEAGLVVPMPTLPAEGKVFCAFRAKLQVQARTSSRVERVNFFINKY
jgi:hypothetical protein